MMTPFEKPIYVTRPFLPPFGRFCDALSSIWEDRWLSNNGPILQRFAGKLKQFLDTEELSLFTNGMQALELGLEGLGISGEVITTPFTFVATTHALHRKQLKPVFVDIEPDYYTLDPDKVEEAVTPNTTAILAVHVYGHPCRLDALAAVARRHHLRLIYDAAHAFGVKVDGAPISRFGDLSMFSFHATKLFHTAEGGLLTFADPDLGARLDYLKNFGFKNEVEVVMPGTNAKMTELQALMGDLMLEFFPEILARRRALYERYREALQDVPGMRLPLPFDEGIEYNYAYAPVEVYEEQFGASRDELYSGLKRYNVFTRRYFYPLVCDFACYRDVPPADPLSIARGVAERILTLPIYPDLTVSEVDRICGLVREIRAAGATAKQFGRLPN
jgi:dTDP-4-amino-4,6-dideoxygalactose transaminase